MECDRLPWITTDWMLHAGSSARPSVTWSRSVAPQIPALGLGDSLKQALVVVLSAGQLPSLRRVTNLKLQDWLRTKMIDRIPSF